MQRRPMFGDYAQIRAVVGVAPGVGHPRRTDRRLTFDIVALLASYASPESTAHDPMALLLGRMDMLRDREARGEHDLDAQQLAASLLSGLKESRPRSEERSFYDVSRLCHGAYSFTRSFRPGTRRRASRTAQASPPSADGQSPAGVRGVPGLVRPGEAAPPTRGRSGGRPSPRRAASDARSASSRRAVPGWYGCSPGRTGPPRTAGSSPSGGGRSGWP